MKRFFKKGSNYIPHAEYSCYLFDGAAGHRSYGIPSTSEVVGLTLKRAFAVSLTCSALILE
jgi:hypothetical protein